MGSGINMDQSKYMEMRKNEMRVKDLQVDKYKIGGVEMFKYLGSIITAKNDRLKH